MNFKNITIALKNLSLKRSFVFYLLFTLIIAGCSSAPPTRTRSRDGRYKVHVNDLYVYNKGEDVYIVFASDRPVEYNAFMSSDPLRLVLDITDVDVDAIKKRIGIHKGGVLKVSRGKTASVDGARFEVHLMYPRPYEITREKNELIVKFLKPPDDRGNYIDFDISSEFKNTIASGNENRSGEGLDEEFIDEADTENKSQKLLVREKGQVIPSNSNNEGNGSFPVGLSTGGKNNKGRTKLKDIDRRSSTMKNFTNQWNRNETSSIEDAKTTTGLLSDVKLTRPGNSNSSNHRIDGLKETDLIATGRAGRLSSKSRQSLLREKPENTEKKSFTSIESTRTKPSSSNGSRQSLMSSTSMSGTTPGVNKLAGVAKKPTGSEKSNLPGNYKIGPADVLEVLVWRNDKLSKVVIVRPDGMITLPLLGDFKASGKTPLGLRGEIVEKLREYQEVPEVSVIVKQINSYVIYVLGEVMRPGPYNLTRETALLQAITLAGGFTQFAARNNIIVLRNVNGNEQRFKIRYKDIISGESVNKNIKLESGDTIIVP